MRSWMKVLSCVVVLFCIGQAAEDAPVLPTLDQAHPPAGERIEGLWTCYRAGADCLQYQQRVTMGQYGTIARLEVTTFNGVPMRIGISRAEPWVDVDDSGLEIATFDIVTKDKKRPRGGDVWVPVDLRSLGWAIEPGDVVTIHYWPTEPTCLGFTYMFGPPYDGGPLWIERGDGGIVWGPGTAAAAFRLYVDVD